MHKGEQTRGLWTLKTKACRDARWILGGSEPRQRTRPYLRYTRLQRRTNRKVIRFREHGTARESAPCFCWSSESTGDLDRPEQTAPSGLMHDANIDTNLCGLTAHPSIIVCCLCLFKWPFYFASLYFLHTLNISKYTYAYFKYSHFLQSDFSKNSIEVFRSNKPL